MKKVEKEICEFCEKKKAAGQFNYMDGEWRLEHKAFLCLNCKNKIDEVMDFTGLFGENTSETVYFNKVTEELK